MFKKGFSLIEILIVISLMAIIASVVVGGFSLFKNAQALDRDTDMVVEVLREARTQTLASKNASVYGVHFAPRAITFFSGATFTAGATDNVTYSLAGSDTALSASLTGGVQDVVFSRLTGETSQNGTVVVSSTAANRSRTITIQKTGLIEFN